MEPGVASVVPSPETIRLYPLPAVLRVRSVKVATPLTAETVVVPPSEPPAGPPARLTVTVPLKAVLTAPVS